MRGEMARVLIIDDDEAMREGMAVTVAKMGHEAVAAAGGAEGLATLKRRAFDLVVTDLRMEGVTGLDVVEALADEPGTAVMVVTAFGTVEAAVEAMRRGALEFIEKPFSPDVLRARVELGL
jgi:two-component system response regulator HydG